MAPFFADFGAEATLGASTVTGIFDARYVDPLGVASSSPVFIGSSAQLAEAAFGGTITISSIAYTIVGVEPDGTGVTVLRLEAP